MKTNKAGDKNPEISELVRTLLKIDPAALASLGGKRGATDDPVAAGLHEFMRAVIEGALGLLWAPDDCKVRLRTDSTRAFAIDAKIWNLIQVFSVALVREPRRTRGRRDLQIFEADSKIIDLPRRLGTKERSSFAELLPLAIGLFDADFDAMRDAPGPIAFPISMSALLTDLLGVQPDLLISLYYDSKGDAEAAYNLDPDGQAFAGVAACLTRVLRHVPLILSENIDCIRFALTGDDASNFAALLTLGCLADGTRDLGFVRVGN